MFFSEAHRGFSYCEWALKHAGPVAVVHRQFPAPFYKHTFRLFLTCIQYKHISYLCCYFSLIFILTTVLNVISNIDI